MTGAIMIMYKLIMKPDEAYRADNMWNSNADGLTLLGSLTSTYLPSGCFISRSVTVRTIPQPLANETLS